MSPIPTKGSLFTILLIQRILAMFSFSNYLQNPLPTSINVGSVLAVPKQNWWKNIQALEIPLYTIVHRSLGVFIMLLYIPFLYPRLTIR